ncbi:MAG TPA: hypothetical protein VFS93_04965 [Terrimesophilobacter sp.]|nr:hypothetical protein [Terrimesophilobacter sp.]
MSIILGYDAATLREKVDLIEAGQRLALLEEQDEPATLTERIGLLRLVGRLDEALVLAEESLEAARENGDEERVLLARIRRAQVRQFRGELDIALHELADCAATAHDHGWESTEAFALQHHGKTLFEKQDFAAALTDFRQAITLRESIDAPAELVESCRFAADAAEARLAEPPSGDPPLAEAG